MLYCLIKKNKFMKKLMILLVSMLLFGCAMAQNPPDTGKVAMPISTVTPQAAQNDVNQEFLQKIWGGLLDFIGYLNWGFIVAFIIFSGIINMYAKAENKAGWLNWLNKIPTAIWILLFGILLAILWWWGILAVKGKQEAIGLLFSIFFAMGVYKMGVDKLINWIAQRLGFQLPK